MDAIKLIMAVVFVFLAFAFNEEVKEIKAAELAATQTISITK